MQNAQQIIHASHGLNGNSEKLRDYYRQWAPRYDDDVRREAYGGPDVVASIASLMALSYLNTEPDSVRILDAGCGTGLGGIALKQRGFQAIDGFDLSQEMIIEAQKTGIYDDLKGGVDLNASGLRVFDRAYDLVVCCGVFTLGHVEPLALCNLARFLTRDGYLIVSTRNSYLETSDFELVGTRLVSDGCLREVLCMPDARYIAEEDAHYWVYQRGPQLT